MTRSDGRRGAAMFEFALSFMVVFSLFAGTFQWGYTFYVYNTLVSQVRAGARYASSQSYNSDTETAVKNVVVYGTSKPSPGAQPCVTGLATSNVSLSASPNDQTVTVSITGFTINAVFGKFALEGRPNATFPYSGTSGFHDIVADRIPDQFGN